jgi:hypothetical protein
MPVREGRVNGGPVDQSHPGPKAREGKAREGEATPVGVFLLGNWTSSSETRPGCRRLRARIGNGRIAGPVGEMSGPRDVKHDIGGLDGTYHGVTDLESVLHQGTGRQHAHQQVRASRYLNDRNDAVVLDAGY